MLGIKGSYLNITKVTYNTFTAYWTTWGKAEHIFCLISETIQGCLLSSLLFNILLEILVRTTRREKEKVGRKLNHPCLQVI